MQPANFEYPDVLPLFDALTAANNGGDYVRLNDTTATADTTVAVSNLIGNATSPMSGYWRGVMINTTTPLNSNLRALTVHYPGASGWTAHDCGTRGVYLINGSFDLCKRRQRRHRHGCVRARCARRDAGPVPAADRNRRPVPVLVSRRAARQ